MYVHVTQTVHRRQHAAVAPCLRNATFSLVVGALQ